MVWAGLRSNLHGLGRDDLNHPAQTTHPDLLTGTGIPLGNRSTSPWIPSSDFLAGRVSAIKNLGGSGG